MADGKKIIEVTEEEFDYLMRLRVELQRREAAGEPVEIPPEFKRRADLAMGVVAGAAAYWLYKELLEDEEEPVEVKRTTKKGTKKKARRG